MYNSVHFTKGETKKERCRYANLKKSYLMSRMKLVVLSGGVGNRYQDAGVLLVEMRF